jgi:hypothetical protein
MKIKPLDFLVWISCAAIGYFSWADVNDGLVGMLFGACIGILATLAFDD